MENVVADRLADIIHKFHINGIPKVTPEEAQKHSEQVEQRLVNEYQTKRAKNFTRVRSIYNEKNVLNHVFKDVKPVSDEFTVLAKKALVIAKKYANGERFNTVLSGQAGAGKTMLAVCIMNYLRSKQPQAKCLFISVTELSELAFSQYHKEEYDQQAKYNQAFKDIAECDLLVLDDLGTESSMTIDTSESSNTVQKMLFRIGDLMQGKRLVITTNNNGEELTEMYNPKIISRLLTSNQEHILKFENVEDYRQQHN
ncbi:MAG TPA: DnaA/Hda family protein [Enterococcus sp.]|nr:DnaA/Hda family protein [Enterococcus sp.]